MRNVSEEARRHWAKARQFHHHANSTKNPATREMYLRLARNEEALAERAERMSTPGHRGKDKD